MFTRRQGSSDIGNGGNEFLIKLNLIFSMSLWKEFQLLQILNDLSIKHFIKLLLHENDVTLLKFESSPEILRFVKSHEDISKDRSQRRTHGYSIDLIIKLTAKGKMSL